jgi:hypothetical protein
MTENNENTPVEAPNSPVEPQTDEGQGIIPDDAAKDKIGNEAAKYRVRAREAEAERDTLAARLSVLQRAEIERLASAGLSHPSDLFSLSGNQLADYLTDDGTVDSAKVSADLEAILSERPGLKPAARAIDRTQGLGGGQQQSSPSWESMFQI